MERPRVSTKEIVMKRRTLALAILAAGTLAVAFATVPSADAQPGPGMGWGQGAGRGQGAGMGMGRSDAPWRERFAAIDTDGNGTISAAEMRAQAEGVFAAMDVNSDNRLTREEYMAVRMGAQRGYNTDRQAQMQSRKAARFGTWDTDHDGFVAAAEFAEGHEAEFRDADRNGDGALTPVEFRGRNW